MDVDEASAAGTANVLIMIDPPDHRSPPVFGVIAPCEVAERDITEVPEHGGDLRCVECRSLSGLIDGEAEHVSDGETVEGDVRMWSWNRRPWQATSPASAD